MNSRAVFFLFSLLLFAESAVCISNEQLRKEELKVLTPIGASSQSSISSPQQVRLLNDVRCSHVNSLVVAPWERKEESKVSRRRLPKHVFKERRLSGEPPMDPFVDGGDASTEEVESKQGPWSFELSDIPLDPTITYGELENGIRYYVLPNSEPPGQMELRLHIDAGANFETDEEDGMAHYLEHMMFQTTKSHPDGDLIPTLQRLGIGFGMHLNAYTDFEETVYFLSLPNLENDTLATSFGWLRDVVDGALLEESEIEAEQGVVVSELEYRDSVEARLVRELYQWIMPDHLLSKRFVIGTKETIMGVTKDMLDAFYQEYYVPRRATLIAVGDFNASVIVSLIEDHFGTVKDSGDRGDSVDYGTLPVGVGLRTNVFVDNQLTYDVLGMITAHGYDFIPDTEEQRIESMKLSIANSILSKRLDDIALEPNSTILAGYTYYGHWYDSVAISQVEVYPKTGLWPEAVAIIEQEIRRAIEHGFTEFEVEKAKADTLVAYEQWVLEKDSRQSAYLADILNTAVSHEESDFEQCMLALLPQSFCSSDAFVCPSVWVIRLSGKWWICRVDSGGGPPNRGDCACQHHS
jgi:zinc protease